MKHSYILYTVVFAYICILISVYTIRFLQTKRNHKTEDKEADGMAYAEQHKQHVDTLCKTLYDDDIPSIYKKYYIVPDVLSREQCNWIIHEAEAVAQEKGGWETDRHNSYPTVDIEVNDIPLIRNFMHSICIRDLIPLFEKYYNLNPHLLGIKEIFIAKYTDDGQRLLEEHIDASEFSFVIPLNDEFEGGGTIFSETGDIVDAAPGSALLFSGRQYHQGREVTKGTRYICAGFLHYAGLDYCDENFDQ